MKGYSNRRNQTAERWPIVLSFSAATASLSIPEPPVHCCRPRSSEPLPALTLRPIAPHNLNTLQVPLSQSWVQYHLAIASVANEARPYGQSHTSPSSHIV